MKISNILESFDTAPAQWKWDSSIHSNTQRASFTIDNINYGVTIFSNEGGEVEINFSSNGRAYMTNTGNQYKVLNTVIDIMRTFVTKNYEHINTIYFESMKETSISSRNSNARSKVYERLIKKNIDSLPGNWKLTRFDDDDHTIFKIVKQE